MIQVTIDLKNEHVLRGNLQNLMNELNEEQVKEITEKVLFKYLTDIVDYDKEMYIQSKIDYSRENGIKNARSSWNNKSKEELKDLSDEQIKKLQGFTESYLATYKSPKESRFESLNSMIDDEIKKSAVNFIKENSNLHTLISEKESKIAENFEEIIRDTIMGILGGLVSKVISSSYNSSYGFDQIQNIQQILQRNNLY